MNQSQSKSQNNTLLVLIPGLGAVGTTFLAGVFAHIRHGRPVVGSISQNYKVSDPTGQPNPRNFTPLSEHLGLPSLSNLAFAAWDITPENAYESAKNAGVLSPQDLEMVREDLEAVEPMPGVFISDYVRRLDPSYVKKGQSRSQWVDALRAEVANLRRLVQQMMSTRASTSTSTEHTRDEQGSGCAHVRDLTAEARM